MKSIRFVCVHAACFVFAITLAMGSPARAMDAFATVLQPFVDRHILAGAVTIVADKDKVLDVTTVGYADVAAKKSMKADDLFWIASMSKPITGAAFMILVDEGKVNVDDPVEKYLPEFKGQMVAEKGGNPHAPKHPITIRNVLSHTSGLPFASPMERPTLDQNPLSERVASYAKLRLEFEPDTKYQYSNAGINTAGRIIEVVSGMSYEDFLDKRLFQPLGMKDTTFWPTEEQIARIAKSYKANQDKSDIEETNVGQLRYPLNDHANRFPMPAGGLFSTAEDCTKFCQMLLNGGVFNGKRILSEASVKQMTSKQTASSVDTPYGFGFSTGGGSYGHGGAYSTNMTVDPKTGLITVFMVQNAGWRSEEGNKIEGTFRSAAMKAFAKKSAATGPKPSHADVSFGPHPHQLIDIYLPTKGEAPYPALLWYGGIWKPAKHPANLGFFLPRGIAVIAVQTRTMDDATAAGEKVPASYVQSDAVRAVQFVRHNASKWNLDPKRLATGGGSQGAQPALFVGCSRDWANSSSNDPVEHESSLVTCVAAYRCQPTFDPMHMQEWVPGVKWGSPALGCSFEESLKRRDVLLPILQKWSPDYLLHKGAAPMFFENEWPLTKPENVEQNNFDVHSPAWALGFQKLARASGAECHVKFPGHPADDAAKDIWDFVAKRLRP